MTARRLLFALGLLLLCATAVLPLLRAESPCTHDGDLHYYRVVALRQALEQGILFSRWLPDLAFGYGYPFFHYRAPVSYYLALALWLTGLPLPLALNLVYVLSILGAAAGAYLLARDLFGPSAGVVAAVAYAYAPYTFLDALLRGNAPESVALALMPLALWAFRRLLVDGGRRWFAAAVGLLATLYLTHNISSLLFTPFLLLYLLLLGAVYRQPRRWLWAALALVLALSTCTFFLLPALAEKGLVQLHMSRVTRNNDFHYNFLDLAEMFAPPSPVDSSLLNPPMEVQAGLALSVLAGLGLVVGLAKEKNGRRSSPARHSRASGNPLIAVTDARFRGHDVQVGGCFPSNKCKERRASLIFFAVSALVFLFMSTEASLWLWENVPLLPFAQFPWRFVGRAILPLALVAAAAFSQPPGDKAARWTTLAALLAVALLILAAFPATAPPYGYCPRDAQPTIADVHRYERQSRLVGVDPEGSYFPVWVEQRPQGSPLEAQYAAGGEIARFDTAALPEGAAILAATYGSNEAVLVVESPDPFSARYRAFYFPGWRAWIDGQRVDVVPSEPEGLIAFDVPAGRHEITIRFGETPLRVACDVVSLFSFLAFVFLVPSLKSPSPRPQAQNRPPVALLSGGGVLAAALLLTLKLAVVDRVDTLFRYPTLQPGGVLPGVSRPLNQPYADGMLLAGYELSADELPADGTLRVDLYWTTWQQPTRSYQATVHLVGPEGFRWSPQDSYRPRGYHRPPPTSTWQPGQYAVDSHEIEPLPGTPPGDYQVVVVIFDRDTLAPLSVLNAAGQPAAPELALAPVALARPRQPAGLPARDWVEQPVGDLTLLGADFDRAAAAPGDSVYLTLFWRAEAAVDAAPAATLELRAPDGTMAASYDLPLPASTWQAGDAWRGQHRLVLPADLESGAYRWVTQQREVSTLQVQAPAHLWQAPPVDLQTEAHFGRLAALLGVQLSPQTCNLQSATWSLEPGTPFTVTLVWRAESTAADSYHVFVHLLDAAGGLAAQSDGIPAGWARPTTGWLPGEYVRDVHRVVVPAAAPPGDYVLQAGLYLPGGERLRTADGRDAVPLVTVTVTAR
ncbi:MAG: glycosyltransferase family 39 protein [Anaerolineae bacterium]|nr:glycosyltransferase family 39 protein [Anaerolineae bacterium]